MKKRFIIEEKKEEDKQIIKHLLRNEGDSALCGNKTSITFQEINKIGRVYRVS